MSSEFEIWWKNTGRAIRYGPPPQDAKCKHCGSKEKLAPINMKPEYVCAKCWDKYGYECDLTPW